MTGSVTLTAEASTKLMLEPRIAATRTHVLFTRFYPVSMPKKPAPGPPPRTRKPTPPDRIPRVIDAPALDDHLEVMTRAIFQAGLSWAFIDARWDAFRTAFENFNPTAIATYGEGEIERLMEADGVVHSRAKIAGTIANARALRALVVEHGGVAAYVRSFPTYDALYADAKKRFAYLGDLSSTTGSSAPACPCRPSSAGWNANPAITRACAKW